MFYKNLSNNTNKPCTEYSSIGVKRGTGWKQENGNDENKNKQKYRS
jgi:hypothetical protein